VVNRLVERLKDPRLFAVAAFRFGELFGFFAALPPQKRKKEGKHTPTVPPFFHFHLEKVAQVVEARTALTEPTLLLDAGRLGIALRHDEPTQRISELTGNLLPDGMPEKISKANPPIRHRVGQKDAPPILRQLHVLEVSPTVRFDAHGSTQVHVVVVLEPLRPHVAPPLHVLRLPVLERTQQPLIARQVDVVRDALSGNHFQYSPLRPLW